MCSLAANSTNNFHIDLQYTASVHGVTINCTDSGEDCDITCGWFQACNPGDVLKCDPNKDCTIECQTRGSCNNTIIHCPINGICQIDCGTNQEYECQGAIINCATNTQGCHVNCGNENACINTIIYWPTDNTVPCSINDPDIDSSSCPSQTTPSPTPNASIAACVVNLELLTHDANTFSSWFKNFGVYIVSTIFPIFLVYIAGIIYLKHTEQFEETKCLCCGISISSWFKCIKHAIVLSIAISVCVYCNLLVGKYPYCASSNEGFGLVLYDIAFIVIFIAYFRLSMYEFAMKDKEFESKSMACLWKQVLSLTYFGFGIGLSQLFYLSIEDEDGNVYAPCLCSDQFPEGLSFALALGVPVIGLCCGAVICWASDDPMESIKSIKWLGGLFLFGLFLIFYIFRFILLAESISAGVWDWSMNMSFITLFSITIVFDGTSAVIDYAACY